MFPACSVAFILGSLCLHADAGRSEREAGDRAAGAEGGTAGAETSRGGADDDLRTEAGAAGRRRWVPEAQDFSFPFCLWTICEFSVGPRPPVEIDNYDRTLLSLSDCAQFSSFVHIFSYSGMTFSRFLQTRRQRFSRWWRRQLFLWRRQRMVWTVFGHPPIGNQVKFWRWRQRWHQCGNSYCL